MCTCITPWHCSGACPRALCWWQDTRWLNTKVTTDVATSSLGFFLREKPRLRGFWCYIEHTTLSNPALKKCSEIGQASAKYQENESSARREGTDSLENLKSINQKLPFDLISGYQANRPDLSSKNPHFQNEARCTTFLVKMSFIRMLMKNDFHIKGWESTLVLKQRPRGTRKLPIKLNLYHNLTLNKSRLILTLYIFYRLLIIQIMQSQFRLFFKLLCRQILPQKD